MYFYEISEKLALLMMLYDFYQVDVQPETKKSFDNANTLSHAFLHRNGHEK